MEISLPPEQQASLDGYVKSGRFGSVSEAVQAAIELLDEQQQELSMLRAAVDEADEDIANGRYTEYDRESLPRLLEDLRMGARAERDSRLGR